MDEFYSQVLKICREDKRYRPDAYEFVMQAVIYAQKNLGRKGHVSGKELLAEIRRFAMEEFGPMAKTVFEHWGIRSTDDFGQIVFNMVKHGALSKTDEDSINDFHEVYRFEDVFKDE